MNYLYALYVQFLNSVNLPEAIAMLTFPILPFIVVAIVLILVVLILVLMERKVLGLFTQRFGPNRVGPWGLLQTVADAIKLLCKENIELSATDKILFTLAPILAFVPVMVVWGLIPYSAEFSFMNFSTNMLLFIAISSIPVMAIVLAGYASNNKYSLIGSIRSVAQVISYELPVMFSILSIAVLASSLNLKDIVMAQNTVWFIFPSFIGFLVMFICSIAELNRCPFDLPEAESELVGGYNTEYSGMRFALFFLGEYAMLFVISAFLATLFLGGFLSPFGFYMVEKIIPNPFIANIFVYFEQAFWLFLKTFLIIFVIMWVRATLPRLNSANLLAFTWSFLLPLSIINFLGICCLKYALNLGGVG